jgi:hypothetical protein
MLRETAGNRVTQARHARRNRACVGHGGRHRTAGISNTTKHEEEKTMEAQASKMKAVYTVVNRGEGKSFWTRVGIGFVNQDGSWNLKLDAIPTNGTLQVREWEAQFDKRDGREGDLAPLRKAREIA